MIWTKDSYALYLATEHWQATRRAALEAGGWRCNRCGWCSRTPRGLEVHHRTYDRLGAEWPADLEVLCGDCHAGHHGKERDPQHQATTFGRSGHFEHISRIIPRALAKMGFTWRASAP